MEYLLLLFNQFNESRGYKTININSKIYIDEFVHWLKDLKELSHLYFDFAVYEGINLNDDDYIELNKGRYDSIKKAKIISPFASTLGIQNKKLIVCQGEPNIIIGSNIKKGQVVDTYTTFNPYNNYFLNNLNMLHNNDIRICYGIFGKNTDINKNFKIEQFIEFISKLKENYIYNIENVNGNYVGIVFSKRQEKRFVLNK